MCAYCEKSEKSMKRKMLCAYTVKSHASCDSCPMDFSAD